MKAKKKRTRLWSILLVLVMVVGMLPTVALAAETATETADFTDDPTTALALLNAHKTENAENSKWDNTTNTLTLNGVNFETTAATAVKLPDSSTIILNGVNTIKGGSSSGFCRGIEANGSLVIQGTGTLNVTSGSSTREDSSFGIQVYNNDDSSNTGNPGNLTIEGGVVNATGGTAKGSSIGIRATNMIIISGGTVNAYGSAGSGSYGIKTKFLTISRTANVTANGGTAANGNSCGIFADGKKAMDSVTISDTANVTANGGTATNGNSCGIYANKGNVTISGDTTSVTANGGTADYESYGIRAYENVIITDSTVIAEGGYITDTRDIYKKTYGICAGEFDYDPNNLNVNNLTINGASDVTAHGGNSPADKTESCGIIVGNRSVLTISDTAKVNATGGTVSRASYGIYSKYDNFSDYGIIISDKADVTATGGTGFHSFGLSSGGSKISISGATVRAKSGAAEYISVGINTTQYLYINGATVEAYGNTVTDADAYYSCGIYAGRSVNITGDTADVTAIGGTASNNAKSYGIYADEKGNIAGGTVTAKAGNATNASALRKALSASSLSTYWWRTSESGAYNKSADSEYTFDSAHTYVEIRYKEPAAATTYIVTVTNGTASVSQAAAGTTVTLTANTAPDGQVFDKWEVVSGGITLANATSATTTFKMPASAVSVKATYKNAPTTGDVSGYIPPVQKPIVKNDDNETTSADLKDTTSTSGGKTIANVDKAIGQEIVDKAVANESKEIVIDANAKNASAAAATVIAQISIPRDTLAAIAEKTEADVTVKNDVAEIKLDNSAAGAVAEQAAGDTIQVIVEKVAEKENKVEFQLKVVCSAGNVISDFQGGNVAVTVAIPKEMADKKVVCIYIDDNGKMSKVKGQKNEDGTYTFTTGHFSTYVLMPEKEADAAIAAQQKEETLAKLDSYELVARSAAGKTSGGKKAIKIRVYDKNGLSTDFFDGIEIYRSTKKNSGYGKKPVFVIKSGKSSYYNTAIKSGTRYYYKVCGFVMIDGQKYYTDYSLKAIRTAK